MTNAEKGTIQILVGTEQPQVQRRVISERLSWLLHKSGDESIFVLTS